jgi:glycosyltransferase involved in cell wall biosynthesis
VLPFAIESCLSQTVSDFELLVVGDGCTDYTADVMAKFTDPRVKWFDRPKAPGFGYAHRNFALREALGELIAWQAHDDLWMPRHLEKMLALFSNPRIEWAHSRPTWVTPEGWICPANFFLDDPATRKLFLSMGDSLLHANCVVHRRSCTNRHGYWNEKLPSCGDWDYWKRIIKGGSSASFAVLREMTTLHFRAKWRTDANAHSPRLNTWRDWHHKPGELQSALRLLITDGRAPQQIFWQQINDETYGWPEKINDLILRADTSRHWNSP